MILLSWFTSFFIGLGYTHEWIYPDKVKNYFFSGAGAGAFSGAGAGAGAFSGAGAGAAGFASSLGAGFGGSADGPQLTKVKLVKKAIAMNNITSFFMYFHLLSLCNI
ncbi:MAG: hypothetical protein NT178_11095 [Proteobacteria bacterium]|nr:hypothetical protein [Pseudomonadota bacterium]